MAAYTPTKDENQGEMQSPLRDGRNQRQDLTSAGSASKAVWYSRTLTPYEENPNISTFSYGSLEAYGGDEINQSANIFEELEELRCQNQKLVETNETLHRRLETAEELKTELVRKVEDAKYTINSLQVKQCFFKEQSCKLREDIKQLENNCVTLQTKVGQLEKEKQSLGKKIRQMESEDNEKLSLRQTIASLEDEMERAKLEILSKDTKLKDVMKHRDGLIEEVIEENKNYHELYQNHQDLQAAFQALKIERGDMEHTGLNALRSSFGDELCDRNENLLSELRTVVNEGAGPSPICGLVNFETTSSEMMVGLQAVVDSVSAEMEKLMSSQLSNQSDQEVFEQTMNNVKSQHSSLLCKVKWILEAKKHSDQRAVSMGDKLTALRDDNTQLKSEIEHLKEDLTELTDATNQITHDETDHRLIQAQNELELARAEVELMEFTSSRDKQRISDLESMLSILKKELELKSSELLYGMPQIEEQFDATYNMKRQHVERRASSENAAENLVKGGYEPRRIRCSQCKRESVVRRRDQQITSSSPIQGQLDARLGKLKFQNLSHLDEFSSDEDVPDSDSIEPLLESGYRTEASIGRSPIPSKPFFSPHHSPISKVIDALALDVFPQPFHPSPSADRSTFLSRSTNLCPRCGSHLTPTQQQIFPETPYPKIFSAFDPLSLLSGDGTSTTNLSDNLEDLFSRSGAIPDNLEGLFKNEELRSLVDFGAQTEGIDGEILEVPVLSDQKKVFCIASIQTDPLVRVFNVVGTQTESDVACLVNQISKATSTDCIQGTSTCSRGVSASVVLTEAQSQTDSTERICATLPEEDELSKEVSARVVLTETHTQTDNTDVISTTVPLDNEINAFSGKEALTESSSSQTDSIPVDKPVAVRSIAIQTLPNPTTSESSFSFDLTVPVPDHQVLSKTSSTSSSASSNYLAPSNLPAHLIADDWDSDISADSPLFVSARSSPLAFGKQEGEALQAVETLSFKPIIASREKMAQALPVCLDENSNNDIVKFSPTKNRETILNADKSTMRQRRSLEREKKYSGVIQASNGDIIDLTTAEIDVSSMSPADQALNAKLLSESRQITEKFENRRGRRFSPVKKDNNVVCDDTDDTSPDSSPEPRDDLSPRLITQEERVGAEGDSDPEEEKAKSRKDSDEFDIKADIMKAIGPIKRDGSPKSALSSSKIRQEKKAKRPVFKLPMPELSEEMCEDPSLASSTSLPNGTLESISESRTDKCRVEVPSECSIKPEGEVKWEGGEGEGKQRKSSILSDTLLKALGLKKGEGDKKAVLTEQEVEEKYNSLTFAFKTDRLTLEQRYKLQQHQRNILEKNLYDELGEHAGVVQSLERRYADDEIARTDINKLKQHIDVIRYALEKLASKAEGFGAVQQEDRLSRASEIMVTHVENVKRNLEREKLELSEAKRVLHENKILLRSSTINNDDTDVGSRLRRSSTMTSPAMKHSLHGIVRQKLMRKNPSICEDDESKRRASVAAVLGFGSSPHSASSMAKNHNRAQSIPMAVSPRNPKTLSLPLIQVDGRNRFASLANAALIDRASTSPLATRSSLEPVIKEVDSERGDSPRSTDTNKKKLSVAIAGSNHSSDLPQLSPIKPIPSPTSGSPTNKMPVLASTPVVISGDGEGRGSGDRTKTEEEIFQQGFEQGVRSQISQELDDLRDQQRALCENLEEIMEAADDEEDEENVKNSETQPMLKWMQHCSKNIPWSKASKIGRLLLTGTLFILAIISIIGTVLPLERCTGSSTVLSGSWEEVVRVLGPYTNIYSQRPPPK